MKLYIRNYFWSFFLFSFYDITVALMTSTRSVIPSMKSLRPDELWNSKFMKLIWCIHYKLCNTLSGVWGQYPIINQISISDAAK